jgi:peptidoglycan/xylan/chitin deacetylase (PgdA/CDA1 family)
VPGSYKRVILGIFEKLGGFGLSRYMYRTYPRILIFHRFAERACWRHLGKDAFEEQIRILKERFQVISLETLYAHVANGERIPVNSVILTVDDGYEDFYQYAFPILRKYSVPATVYLSTDFIDKKIWLWPDMIRYVVWQTGLSSFLFRTEEKEREYDLSAEQGRRAAWNDIAGYCLTLWEEDRNQLIRNLAQDLKVSLPPVPTPGFTALTWEQIREMMENGIDVGSHTCTHPRLVCVKKENLIREIIGSKERIQEMTGAEVKSFCYPNGEKADYDDHIKEMVKKAGYTNAVVAFWDIRNIFNLFEWGRYGIDENMMYFKKVAYGVEMWLSFMRRRFGKVFC